MALPVPPLGTSNIGVDAAGVMWRNTPEGLVEIGGGGPGLGPPEHLTDMAMATASGTWGSFSVPAGAWLCWVTASGVAAAAGNHSLSLTGQVASAVTTNIAAFGSYNLTTMPVRLDLAASTVLTATTIQPAGSMILSFNAVKIVP